MSDSDRRAFLKKVAKTTAYSAPVIRTLAAPDPAAGQALSKKGGGMGMGMGMGGMGMGAGMGMGGGWMKGGWWWWWMMGGGIGMGGGFGMMGGFGMGGM